MSLLELYNLAIKNSKIANDDQQRFVLNELEQLANLLKKPTHRWLYLRRQSPIKGIYLYGSVGVGKTYLMDLFYENLQLRTKSRFHFHHFMQQIDAQLRRLQGQKNPVQQIAKNIAKSTSLLCLDEFLVHDVAEAMILSEVLQELFAQNVVIVATANTPPDDLYLNGVQRIRFLPAIALIKQQCRIIALTTEHDYRLGRESCFAAYLYPLNQQSNELLKQQFVTISKNLIDSVVLEVQNRFISCVQQSAQAVWFKFDVICNVPRCQLDYLEIASRMNTVFVSDIPVLSPDDTVYVILFMHFIDVMYDQGIRLVISADVPAAELYISGPLLKPFQRTLSRLKEMQSEDYINSHKHHNMVNFLID